MRSTTSYSSDSKKSNPVLGKIFEKNLASVLEINLPIIQIVNGVINENREYFGSIVEAKIACSHPNFLRYAQTKININVKDEFKINFDQQKYKAKLLEQGKKLQVETNTNKMIFTLNINEVATYDNFIWYFNDEIKEYSSVQVFSRSKLFKLIKLASVDIFETISTKTGQDIITFYPNDFYKVNDLDLDFPYSLVEKFTYSFSAKNFDLDPINENTEFFYNTKKDTIISEGTRNEIDGIWECKQNFDLNILYKEKSKQENNLFFLYHNKLNIQEKEIILLDCKDNDEIPFGLSQMKTHIRHLNHLCFKKEQVHYLLLFAEREKKLKLSQEALEKLEIFSKAYPNFNIIIGGVNNNKIFERNLHHFISEPNQIASITNEIETMKNDIKDIANTILELKLTLAQNNKNK